ncbi:hypothetical protein ZWY2020_015060 [Hordeum vulgare]|nr:hypothetical protein ZWY2020_015060 [Hordeum vulgare]
MAHTVVVVVSRMKFAKYATHQDDALDDGVSVIPGSASWCSKSTSITPFFHVPATGIARSPVAIDEGTDERVTPCLQAYKRRLDAAETVDPAKRRKKSRCWARRSPQTSPRRSPDPTDVAEAGAR